ncbi:MAG: Na+/H+ antiporter subunit E [Gammaproteobacteria bacterium]
MNFGNSRALVYKTLALFATWLVLSQSLGSFNLGLGFLASFAVAYLNSGHGKPMGAKIRLGQTILYFPWLLFKVLQSGIHVSYLILHPRLPIDPKLIRYHTKLSQPAGIVTLGNSITLTPGTITAEVNSTELLVHAMDDEAADDLTGFRMERKVAGVFGVEQ